MLFAVFDILSIKNGGDESQGRGENIEHDKQEHKPSANYLRDREKG